MALGGQLVRFVIEKSNDARCRPPGKFVSIARQLIPSSDCDAVRRKEIQNQE